MKIYIGGDHAGFELKNKIGEFLKSLGHEVEDMGPHTLDLGDDYPDFVRPVAEAVSKNQATRGIIIGGSGQGETMCANRTKGVRACEFYGGNFNIVKISREHNDCNVLSLGARFLTEDEAKQAVKIFLDVSFSGEARHVRRLKKF